MTAFEARCSFARSNPARILLSKLSADNKFLLLIPKGFAHGFSVQSESAVINYMVDNYYAPDSERGIIYDDPDLSIDWQINSDKAQLSEKDTQYPRLENAEIFEDGINLYDF